MTSSRSFVRVAMVSLVSGALASCGDIPEQEAQTEVVGEIWGANPFPGRGAICLRTSAGGNCCSGSIINNQVLMTAAHCFTDSNQSGFRNVWVEYQGPNGTLNWAFSDAGGTDNQMFVNMHPNWPTDPRPEWDMAIATLFRDQNLNLPSRDFVTIYRGSLKEGNHVDEVGYGGGMFQANNIQRRAQLKVDWVGSNHIKWVNSVIGQMICSGDSGGPGLRQSGYRDGLGNYWDAQATVMVEVFGSSTPGVGICGAGGRASRVSPKFSWINGLVSTWTQWKCTDFTNLQGEKAAWCWDLQ
jgi:V8-like Glu-specific endopeptidase